MVRLLRRHRRYCKASEGGPRADYRERRDPDRKQQGAISLPPTLRREDRKVGHPPSLLSCFQASFSSSYMTDTFFNSWGCKGRSRGIGIGYFQTESEWDI